MKNRYKNHARKRGNQKMKIHQTSDLEKYVKNDKNRKNNIRKKIEKKREKDQSGTLTQGARNTIRSKIEDILTEGKLKDREGVANPNTPWAPSGQERIELPAAKFRTCPW